MYNIFNLKKRFAGIGNSKSNSHMNSMKGFFGKLQGGKNENKNV